MMSVAACDMVISGDSLGLHMGIAMKKWCVAWFGPTCDQEIELYDRGVKVLANAPCSPCWKRVCDRKPMCYDLVDLQANPYRSRERSWQRRMSQLVIQTAYPGDLLLAIPLLKQIRQCYPGEPIVLLCRSGLGRTLSARDKLADEVVEVNKKDRASLQASLAELRKREWSRIFCPHESFRSAIWVRGMRAREFSVGFKKWWNFWAFTKRVEKPATLPDALRQLSLLSGVNENFASVWREAHVERFSNVKDREAHSYRTESEIPPWARMALRSYSKSDGPIFIAPGSVWATKMWTESGFCEVAKQLKSIGRHVVFVGSPSERELCERLASASGTDSVAGKTSIPELIELFRGGASPDCE